MDLRLGMGINNFSLKNRALLQEEISGFNNDIFNAIKMTDLLATDNIMYLYNQNFNITNNIFTYVYTIPCIGQFDDLTSDRANFGAVINNYNLRFNRTRIGTMCA